MSDPVTVRDILILGLVIIVRDGIPWLMKAAFPAWWKATMEKNKAQEKLQHTLAERELELKREIATREFELKREIAERDEIIGNRQTRAMEELAKMSADIRDVLTGNTLQTNNLTHTVIGVRDGVSNLHKDFSAYAAEGRSAFRQIAVLSAQKKPPKKRI